MATDALPGACLDLTGIWSNPSLAQPGWGLAGPPRDQLAHRLTHLQQPTLLPQKHGFRSVAGSSLSAGPPVAEVPLTASSATPPPGSSPRAADEAATSMPPPLYSTSGAVREPAAASSTLTPPLGSELAAVADGDLPAAYLQPQGSRLNCSFRRQTCLSCRIAKVWPTSSSVGRVASVRRLGVTKNIRAADVRASISLASTSR